MSGFRVKTDNDFSRMPTPKGEAVLIRRIQPEPFRGKPANAKGPRRKARQLEHQEQAALFRWATFQERNIPPLENLYAVPNAAKRSPVLGAMMKAEGLKAGMTDVVLAWPVREGSVIVKPGLYIEMKTTGKKPTPDQLKWRNRLITAGYSYYLAFGWQQAANAILDYLGSEYARHRVA